MLIRAAVLFLLENLGMFGSGLEKILHAFAFRCGCGLLSHTVSIKTCAESCGAQYGGPSGPHFLWHVAEY